MVLTTWSILSLNMMPKRLCEFYSNIQLRIERI
jgi:hypothetical protein